MMLQKKANLHKNHHILCEFLSLPDIQGIEY